MPARTAKRAEEKHRGGGRSLLDDANVACKMVPHLLVFSFALSAVALRCVEAFADGDPPNAHNSAQPSPPVGFSRLTNCQRVNSKTERQHRCAHHERIAKPPFANLHRSDYAVRALEGWCRGTA
mmetsp:Transcript_35449/g.77647  ORF Transcript_35449/g.77647 Transcript_35449/m.77647 type:complete len:124 (-) Transcript_35449:275-646(-)